MSLLERGESPVEKQLIAALNLFYRWMAGHAVGAPSEASLNIG
jgi:hypothetical protein